jgi:predicted dehydrogenase
VEDNADLVLSYPNGVGVFEASWDLPQSFQDLEIYGLKGGSLYMKNGSVEMKKGRDSQEVTIDPLPSDRAEPIAYMVSCLRDHKAIEGLTAIDINVDHRRR